MTKAHERVHSIAATTHPHRRTKEVATSDSTNTATHHQKRFAYRERLSSWSSHHKLLTPTKTKTNAHVHSRAAAVHQPRRTKEVAASDSTNAAIHHQSAKSVCHHGFAPQTADANKDKSSRTSTQQSCSRTAARRKKGGDLKQYDCSDSSPNAAHVKSTSDIMGFAPHVVHTKTKVHAHVISMAAARHLPRRTKEVAASHSTNAAIHHQKRFAQRERLSSWSSHHKLLTPTNTEAHAQVHSIAAAEHQLRRTKKGVTSDSTNTEIHHQKRFA